MSRSCDGIAMKRVLCHGKRFKGKPDSREVGRHFPCITKDVFKIPWENTFVQRRVTNSSYLHPQLLYSLIITAEEKRKIFFPDVFESRFPDFLARSLQIRKGNILIRIWITYRIIAIENINIPSFENIIRYFCICTLNNANREIFFFYVCTSKMLTRVLMQY